MEMVYSKNVVGERALQYDFVGTDLRRLNGRDAIYIIQIRVSRTLK
jgi:hypothetical protein